MGVTTITATDPKRLNTANFITRIERPLVLEVWYPAAAAVTEKPDQILATYKDVTRLLKPFELQGQAYRDAPAVAEGRVSADSFIPWLYRLSHPDVLSG